MKKKKRYKTESNRYYTCVYNQGGNGEGFKGLEALKLDTLGRYMTFQNFAVRKVDRPKVRSFDFSGFPDSANAGGGFIWLHWLVRVVRKN